ncbi:MAG TPA: hypothetical protein VKA09_09795 [Nitrososphaeraceae archaeon]|nr:hypothetical protein [Nitrososphaeraceae archaeon]
MKKDGYGHVSSIATHEQDVSQVEIQKAGESVFRETVGHEGHSTCIEYVKNLPVLTLYSLYPKTIISLLLVYY